MSALILSKISLHLDNRRKLFRCSYPDEYGYHLFVYDLYEDWRNDEQKRTGVANGILYHQEMRANGEVVIHVLSNREPRKQLEHGSLQSKIIDSRFFQFPQYQFQVCCSPTVKDPKSGKRKPLKKRSDVRAWVEQRQLAWGMRLQPQYLDIRFESSLDFTKQNHKVRHHRVSLSGVLAVTDREKFVSTLSAGIGRGKAFGLGLFRIIPLQLT